MPDEDANSSKYRGYNPDFVRRALARQHLLQPAAGQPVRVPGVPLWVSELINETARNHSLDVSIIMGKDRSSAVVTARNEILYEVRRKNPRLSFPKIGIWFRRDHTAVMFAIATHARRNALPKLTEFDLDRHNAARKRFIDKRKMQRRVLRENSRTPDREPDSQPGVR